MRYARGKPKSKEVVCCFVEKLSGEWKSCTTSRRRRSYRMLFHHRTQRHGRPKPRTPTMVTPSSRPNHSTSVKIGWFVGGLLTKNLPPTSRTLATCNILITNMCKRTKVIARHRSTTRIVYSHRHQTAAVRPWGGESFLLLKQIVGRLEGRLRVRTCLYVCKYRLYVWCVRYVTRQAMPQ